MVHIQVSRNMRIVFVVSIILQLFIACKCQTLPNFIKKCRFGDSKCIIESMNAVIKRYPRGLAAMGMKPIDNVDIKDSEIWNNAEVGGVWFKFKLFNQVNYGFENATITRIKGFGRDPTASTMEIHGRIPSLIHKGSYIANGRVWLIALNATGESTSDFQNLRFVLKLKVIPEYRNNKRYLKIYELVPIVNISRWIVWLDTLFPENMDLTITLNEVLNANWLEFWNELEPAFLSVFSSVFTGMIEDIFHKISYDDMFLKDNETEINY
ncbi:protein takeout isoform X2 [Drosophila virilis]|uniref:Uncharacterized protein, isoform A n=1 Tax=Drosophila virilis TaxID=7244 RepID=B4M4V3_DROVI|nr:protein takeout isoform X2 [Drosophila virilis]EDW59664.2 uncharacterized protein Dvir_GJ10162, isoform A [Drosophila virilis]